MKRLKISENIIAKVAARLRGQRHVILHNHLFKNAGSTFDWSLQRNFGDSFVDHRDDAQMRKGADYLRPYLIENRRIKALSSHHLTMPLPEIAGIDLIRVMFLRHPIERVASVYNFERAQVSDTHPGVIHAQKYSLRDYVLWRMRPDVGPTIRNFHVRKMLPPRKLGQEKINDGEMMQITKQLAEIELLGLVERFDDCMVLFEERLNRVFFHIDLSYVPQNVSRRSSLTQEGRLEQLKAEIGSETYDLLGEKNLEDLQLLRIAEKEVESRISNTRNFSEKLANFKARCKARSQRFPEHS